MLTDYACMYTNFDSVKKLIQMKLSLISLNKILKCSEQENTLKKY